MVEEPRCPRCGESGDLIDVMQQGWAFCNVCACPFKIRGEGVSVPAVTSALSPDEAGSPHHEPSKPPSDRSG